MITFYQHVPGFVQAEGKILKAETQEELLRDPLFTYWSNLLDFVGFRNSETFVLAVAKDGFSWWVLGTAVPPLDLPKWEGWKFRDMEGRVYAGDEIRSVCGDEMTLKDGRVVRIAR